MEQARVLVAIVTYFSEGVIADCLGSLAAAFAGDFSYEVIVVDNASTDRTTGIVRERFPAATLIAGPTNLGFAAGINTAVAAASRPYDAVLVLNPDIRLEPRSVKPLYETLSGPGVGIAVPRLLDGDGQLSFSLRREPTVSRAFGEAVLGGERAGRSARFGEVITDPKQYEQLRDVAWATGAAMLISRECLDTIGPFDESFFLYSEETDFMLRAGERDLRTRYTPRSTATHLGGESRTSPELWALLTRNRVSLFGRRHGKVRSAAFKSAVVLNEAVRAPFRPTNAAALRAARTGAWRGAAPTCGSRRWTATSASPRRTGGTSTAAHSDFQLMLRVARQAAGAVREQPRHAHAAAWTLAAAAAADRPQAQERGAAAPAAGARRFPTSTCSRRSSCPSTGPADSWSALNAALVRWQVTAAARKLGIHEPAVVVTLPTALRRGGAAMHHRVLVFNHSDKHSAVHRGEPRPHLPV